MKHRPAPKEPTFLTERSKMAYDPRIQKWAKQLKADPEAKPADLNREELAFVQREALGRREESAEARAYEREMRDTVPKLKAPKPEDPIDDLVDMLSLPAMQEMWAEMEPGSRGRRGPKSDFTGAKAAMCVLGMTGKSAHLTDAISDLKHMGKLRTVFHTLNELAAGRFEPTLPGFEREAGQIDAPAYASVARHLPKIAPAVIEAAQAARIKMLKELREYEPEIGKRLMIDGTDLPAWALQVGSRKGDDEREAELREHVPWAGYRAYIRKNGEKAQVSSDDSAESGLRLNIIKAWRGGFVVAITDQASNGLPIVLMVIDASDDEAKCLIPLLSQLHEVWKDIDADDIAGDSAWDEDWACRVCEVDYGIHPIFRLHNRRGPMQVPDAYLGKKASVTHFTEDGRLICAAHGTVLDQASFDRPSRAGKEPGQSTKDGEFRVRAECPDCRTRHGVQAQADWSKLAHYPHHPHGRPELHAYRRARLDCLSEAESTFQRLKVGRKLATKGSDRARFRDIEVMTALCELAATSMVAMALFDMQRQRGVKLTDVSAEAAVSEPAVAQAEAA